MQKQLLLSDSQSKRVRGQHSVKSDMKSSLMQASHAGTESGCKTAPDQVASSDDSDFDGATHIGSYRERSGSVVECLTRDQRAAGSSLTGVTALWSLRKTH